EQTVPPPLALLRVRGRAARGERGGRGLCRGKRPVLRAAAAPLEGSRGLARPETSGPVPPHAWRLARPALPGETRAREVPAREVLAREVPARVQALAARR